MHRLFLVQEIVREILTWVDSPQTAFALARCATPLCEVSLEAVWRHGNAWNLALTVPERFWRIVATKHVITKKDEALVMLTDVPRPPGWAGPRFPLYARSISALTIEFVNVRTYEEAQELEQDVQGKRVHPSVLEAFAQYFPDGSKQMFPRLATIDMDFSPAGAGAACALASPILRSFHLRMLDVVSSVGVPALKGILEAIGNVSRALNTLELQSPGMPALVNLDSCIRNCIHLKSVSLWLSIGDEVFEALAASPHLDTLHLGCIIQVTTLPDLPDAFRALRHLRLFVADEFEKAVAILAIISSPSLELMVITQCRTKLLPFDSFVALTRALGRHTHMKHIGISGNANRPVIANQPPLYDLRTLIAPLLHLHHLRFLSLNIDHRWDCNDAVIAAMAIAWPDLEELTIDTHLGNSILPLDALALMLRTWPHLRILDVYFNVLSPIPPHNDLPATPNRTLTRLTLLTLPMSEDPPGTFDIGALNAFLRAACPSAKCTVIPIGRNATSLAKRIECLLADARQEGNMEQK